MTVLVILALLAGYVVLCLVKPGKTCGRCRGNGNAGRRMKTCKRCGGIGKRLRPLAPTINHGVTAAIRYIREQRTEQKQ